MFEPQELINQIERVFGFRFNRNQSREVQRLLFDIMRREHVSLQDILKGLSAHAEDIQKKYSAGTRYTPLKEILIRQRFPVASSFRKIKPAEVFLNKIPQQLSYSVESVFPFRPEKIIVEKAASGYPLVTRIHRRLSDVPIEYVESYPLYIKEHPFRIEELKRPILFLVKQEGDFIKKCPCTQEHIGCGYFILNMGFGCPFDCSYCYLQQYTNGPGIVLPVNLDDFFIECKSFLSKLTRPIRIGTGEFCDSLALDSLTGYARELLTFFKDKNCFFELKTKSDQIEEVLEVPGARNLVISWSLNTPEYIASEEKSVATLAKRLESAARVKHRGYSVGFHFDPIIFDKDWEANYERLVDTMYAAVQGPYAWISLGTLRSTRTLKDAVEMRFPQSDIFYGELLLGRDKKLRYPHEIRTGIYEKMIRFIRRHDLNTPVYLCMEDYAMWKNVLMPAENSRVVEDYLLSYLNESSYEVP